MKVYSGTTTENYQTCAIVRKYGFLRRKEGVFYVKARNNKKTEYAELFVEDSFQKPAWYALKLSQIFGSDPVIIMGDLSVKQLNIFFTYPGHKPFLVEQVWILKRGYLNNEELLDKVLNKEINARNIFKEASPLDMLVCEH